MAAICGLGSPLEIVNAVLPTNVTLNSAASKGLRGCSATAGCRSTASRAARSPWSISASVEVPSTPKRALKHTSL